MSKYTNAKYPDKINDLIDNEGNINAEKVAAGGIEYLTEAPTEDNLDGNLKFVWLQEEPVERFRGYYYFIGENPSAGGFGSIEPGAVISLKGNNFLVLSTNKDYTDVELLSLDWASSFRWYPSSPSGEQLETWTLINGNTAQGPKYANSNIDQACETFYENLPDGLKDAVLVTNITQDFYTATMSPSSIPEDAFYVDTGISGSRYAESLASIAPATIGDRHAYLPSIRVLESLFGSRQISTETMQAYSHKIHYVLPICFREACGTYTVSYLYLYSSSSAIYSESNPRPMALSTTRVSGNMVLHPALRVNLTKVK